jgi:hypothetical protein
MPVLGASRMPLVDILLGILVCKIHVMQCFMQIGGAHHAGVTIGHIKTTQITLIPIGIPIDSVQERG